MTNKTRNMIIAALSVLIVLCIGVTIWALFFRDTAEPPITPDYPPQGTEDNQKPIEGDTGDKMDSPEGGYDAELLVRAYNDDGEKAMVDTKGDILSLMKMVVLLSRLTAILP